MRKHEQIVEASERETSYHPHPMASSAWADVFRVPILICTFLLIACIPAMIWYASTHWNTASEWVEIGLVVGLVIGGVKIYFSIMARQHRQRMRDLDRREREAQVNFQVAKQRLLAQASIDRVNVEIHESGAMKVMYHLPERVAPRAIVTEEKSTPQKQLPPVQPTLIVPARYDLSSIWQQFTPSLQQIFLGRSAQGDVYVPVNLLWHIALTGPTGGGKTSILRMLLMQLAYLNCHLTLADIHYAPIKEDSNGKPIDWRPIEKRLAQPVIRDIDTIAEWMNWLAFGELQARIDRQFRGEKIGRPMFFTIEELPAVLDEARDKISQPLAKILRQGRQYGICFVGASQDLLTKTLNMSQGPRECFRTGYYTGGDPHTAKALLDLRNGEKIDENGIGIDGLVYLKTAMSPAIQTRVGWASNEALYSLLNVPIDERLGRPRMNTVDADMPDFHELRYQSSNVRAFPQTRVNEPVVQSDATTKERPKEYKLSDVEIEQFIVAYKSCGNIDKALSAMGKGGWYKKHASELVKVHNLRKEA